MGLTTTTYGGGASSRKALPGASGTGTPKLLPESGGAKQPTPGVQPTPTTPPPVYQNATPAAPGGTNAAPPARPAGTAAPTTTNPVPGAPAAPGAQPPGAPPLTQPQPSANSSFDSFKSLLQPMLSPFLGSHQGTVQLANAFGLPRLMANAGPMGLVGMAGLHQLLNGGSAWRTLTGGVGDVVKKAALPVPQGGDLASSLVRGAMNTPLADTWESGGWLLALPAWNRMANLARRAVGLGKALPWKDLSTVGKLGRGVGYMAIPLNAAIEASANALRTGDPWHSARTQSVNEFGRDVAERASSDNPLGWRLLQGGLQTPLEAVTSPIRTASLLGHAAVEVPAALASTAAVNRKLEANPHLHYLKTQQRNPVAEFLGHLFS